MLAAEVETTAKQLHAAQGELENADQEINQVGTQVERRNFTICVRTFT